MKKLVCLVLSLLLCLNAVALAEFVPSKTTGDLTKIEVSVENMPAGATLVLSAVSSDDAVNQQLVATCQAELDRLAATSVSTYFAGVKDINGNEVDLAAVLGTQDLKVYEFCPLIVNDYVEDYGAVTATMSFFTPYAKGEKVLVLVGLINVNEDGIESIEWIAFEGVGTNGGISVQFNAETLMKVQTGNALLAVVSQ